MTKMLDNKNVIITGTRRGMGRAMLEIFASHGANIWAHARKETDEFREICHEIAEKYEVDIWPCFFDMTDYDAMKECVKRIRSFKRPVDGLINNAGITYNALFQMSNINNVREQMEVNFFAPYIFTQYIVKIMIYYKKGSIVNISSSAGLDGNFGKSAYGASKAALIAMTKSIAEELGALGIRANCIAPGITDTDMRFSMPEEVVENIKYCAYSL